VSGVFSVAAVGRFEERVVMEGEHGGLIREQLARWVCVRGGVQCDALNKSDRQVVCVRDEYLKWERAPGMCCCPQGDRLRKTLLRTYRDRGLG